jgi:ABC-type phosphate transport system substrate-binding protein
MAVINATLKQRFEQQYAGTTVELASNGTDAALKSLLAGEVDLAAVGRPLSEAEKAQGLVEVPISREKIAIIVGPNNPFNGSLTFEQFAKIFRGEITDWSQVGGAPGAIRLIDRPELSDTRKALSNYQVFQTAPFQTGANATQIDQDDTATIVQALGDDAISYAIASQVLDQDNVRVVSMHNTLPSDPRYPFSQPRSFVYKDQPSPAAQAFLGFATAPEGQAAIAEAKAAEAEAIAETSVTPEFSAVTSVDGKTTLNLNEDGALQLFYIDGNPIGAPFQGYEGAIATAAFSPDGQTVAAADETGKIWLWNLNGQQIGEPFEGHESAISALIFSADGNTLTSTDTDGVSKTWDLADAAAGTLAGSEDTGATSTAPQSKIPPWLWVLLPLALLALLLWWLSKRRPAGTTPVASGDRSAPSPLPSATTPPVVSGSPSAHLPSGTDAAPVKESTLASRAESIISADRAAIAGTVAPGAAAVVATGLGAMAMATQGSDREVDEQSEVEAAKFDVGQTDLSSEALASVDEGLAELPEGYGESRIVLIPRDPQWAYAYWDVPNEHKVELRRQGGERLALRFYDVTDIDLNQQNPHSLQQYDCDEMARDWLIPVPVSDRNYIAEIGYVTGDGRWLVLARSAPIHIPPVYPSDWSSDQFLTIDWETDLRGQTFATLTPPDRQTASDRSIYDTMFEISLPSDVQRVTGSMFGSMHQVPGSVFGSMQMARAQAISSYIFPSGMGIMSGIGSSASMPPMRPRQFWLVADAELIVYGATEPDATVTIAGQPIQLSPDGTFRFQIHFPDGNFDYPIMAVDVDGEQNRSIYMKFRRETPERHTNTKDEAQDEWL